MNTFWNKHFKNELDPKYAFYDCLRGCELKSTSENSLEECNVLTNVKSDHYQRIWIAKNKNLNSIQYLFCSYGVFI